MFRKLLVAYDGSPEADKALRAGIDLAKTTGAELCIVTVEEGLPPYITAEPYGGLVDASVWVEIQEQRDAYYADLTRRAHEAAEAAGVTLDCDVVAGDEVQSIVEQAKRLKCDLLLVGFHPHSVFADRVLGSTAHAITMAAPCSVLAVK